MKKRCEFQTPELQSFFFLPRARACEMCSHRPVLSTEIGELSCLGNIVSRGFWFSSKTHMKKYVFMLDRQTWFQNGQLGKHNMLATIEYGPPEKLNAKHFFCKHENKMTFTFEQAIQFEPLNPISLNAPFFDRFALQFALQLDLHRLKSGPGSCGCHAISTNRARGDLLRFSLRWGVHAGGLVSETFRWVPRLQETRIRWGRNSNLGKWHVDANVFHRFGNSTAIFWLSSRGCSNHKVMLLNKPTPTLWWHLVIPSSSLNSWVIQWLTKGYSKIIHPVRDNIHWSIRLFITKFSEYQYPVDYTVIWDHTISNQMLAPSMYFVVGLDIPIECIFGE